MRCLSCPAKPIFDPCFLLCLSRLPPFPSPHKLVSGVTRGPDDEGGGGGSGRVREDWSMTVKTLLSSFCVCV